MSLQFLSLLRIFCWFGFWFFFLRNNEKSKSGKHPSSGNIDPAGIFSHPGQHDPSKLLSAARRIRFFLDDGTSDHLPVVQGETQRFTRLLRAHHDVVEERRTPGAHSVAWAVSQLQMVARFLDAGWRGPVT